MWSIETLLSRFTGQAFHQQLAYDRVAKSWSSNSLASNGSSFIMTNTRPVSSLLILSVSSRYVVSIHEEASSDTCIWPACDLIMQQYAEPNHNNSLKKVRVWTCKDLLVKLTSVHGLFEASK